MENAINVISDFRGNSANIDKFHLKTNQGLLELQGGYNKIFISKLKNENELKISFVLMCFDTEQKGAHNVRFSIHVNTEELQFMFGIKEIPGVKKDKKMILLSRFIRFEDYLGIFIERKNSQEKYPGISFFLTKEIKDAIKNLL